MEKPEKNGTLLVDRAHSFIREQVITGVLGPGDRLSEIDFTKSLGVSRGPVREAIRRLVSSGLATMVPNQGARVVQLDEVTIRSLYEIREATEAMGARLAAERMTQSERVALVEMLKEHAECLSRENSDGYPAGPSDWDFHQAVLHGSRNEIAFRLCAGDLRDLLALVRARHRRSPGRGERALQEHRWVADAIIDGNGDLAQTLMASHIRASYRTFMKTSVHSEKH